MLDPARPTTGRIAIAMVVSLLILAAIVVLLIFLMLSLSRATGEDMLGPALGAAGPLLAYVAGFQATLGLGGVLLLRTLDLRAALLWTLTGAVAGLAAGAAYALLEGLAIDRRMLIVCAMLGWGHFLVIRWIVGLR